MRKSDVRAYILSESESRQWNYAQHDEAPVRREIRRSAMSVYPDADTIDLRAPDGAHLETL